MRVLNLIQLSRHSLDNTKKELIEELDKKGIEYKSSMNKQELLNLL